MIPINNNINMLDLIYVFFIRGANIHAEVDE